MNIDSVLKNSAANRQIIAKSLDGNRIESTIVEMPSSSNIVHPDGKKQVIIITWKLYIMGYSVPGPTFCLTASMTDIKFEGLKVIELEIRN